MSTPTYSALYTSPFEESGHPNPYESLCAEFNASVLRSHVPRRGRVLDVGCGNGFLLQELSEYRTIGVDLSFGRLSPGALYATASGENLPFADESFEAVVLAEVIEHLSDWRRLVREVRRVLRPKGWFLVTHPNRLNALQSFLDVVKEIPALRRSLKRKTYSGRQHLSGYAGWESTANMTSAGFSRVGEWTPMLGGVRALAPLYYLPRPPRSLFPLMVRIGRKEREPAQWIGRHARTLTTGVVLLFRKCSAPDRCGR
ncbi:MAG: class I SAM-dependent methyltransferase [Armatimonadetes bacterium]|nr:class I SAM-dependent methyltransferase [Armatimonadota bacterium]NCQ32622.1 class I SAM-dependent methyltransferase [Armatimonadota bacterium]NDK13099.1 class I SAM-dependent methyltransferase [Armatimonadota bacterium]